MHLHSDNDCVFELVHFAVGGTINFVHFSFKVTIYCSDFEKCGTVSKETIIID